MAKKSFAIKIITRTAITRLAILAAALAIFCLWAYLIMLKMPGKSYSGKLPPLTPEQIALRNQLKSDVETLASQIGERNIWQYDNLTAAADFIEKSLTDAGYQVRRQNFTAEAKTCCNLEAELKGSSHPGQIVIIGAHYDTVYGSPGANDNASAVAANLALARHFKDKSPTKTLRFVFFVNEEPPFFQTGRMGSQIYAKSCRRKNENIIAMLSLETIGYYTDKPKTQNYPPPFSLFYPSTGNFLGFVSNLSSRRLLYKVIASFRRNCKFPSEGGAIPSFVPGINWSDHYSFWQQNYPALMLTDTAPFRYPFYHSTDDTTDKLSYDHLTMVTFGLYAVIADLAASN